MKPLSIYERELVSAGTHKVIYGVKTEDEHIWWYLYDNLWVSHDGQEIIETYMPCSDGCYGVQSVDSSLYPF